MSVDIKTDNGWFHIDDLQPNGEEKVLVILERESSSGCTYDFIVCESVYRSGYPNGVVRKEIEECKRHNVNPYKIIEHQKMCGVKVVV